MANFRQTTDALSEWQANMPEGMGSHLDSNIVVGAYSNLIVGEHLFDAQHDDPADIDHMSLLGAATGEYFVTEVLPERPMSLNIVTDSLARSEHPVLTRGKARLVRGLSLAIESAMPGFSDQISQFSFVNDNSRRRSTDIKEIVVPDTEEYTKQLMRIACDGLTFVITDGRRIQLPQNSLPHSQVVAVKFNHLLERRIPANVGVLSLQGGEDEIDTSNSRKLTRKNDELEAEHQKIVRNLREAGVPVAEVTTAKRMQGFDVVEADRQIASAVRSLCR